MIWFQILVYSRSRKRPLIFYLIHGRRKKKIKKDKENENLKKKKKEEEQTLRSWTTIKDKGERWVKRWGIRRQWLGATANLDYLANLACQSYSKLLFSRLSRFSFLMSKCILKVQIFCNVFGLDSLSLNEGLNFIV